MITHSLHIIPYVAVTSSVLFLLTFYFTVSTDTEVPSACWIGLLCSCYSKKGSRFSLSCRVLKNMRHRIRMGFYFQLVMDDVPNFLLWQGVPPNLTATTDTAVKLGEIR